MKAITLFVLALISSAALANGAVLTGQGVRGSMKHCQYSDGSSFTVASYEQCPMTN